MCSIARAGCCLLLVFMLLVVGGVEVDACLEVAVGPLLSATIVVGVGSVVGRCSG